MNRLCPTACIVPILLAGLLMPRHAPAQIGMFSVGTAFELDDAVQIDRADGTVLTQLHRVDAYLADRQWSEAVDTLRGVMENAEEKLIGVTEHRYVTLRDYCHLRLAALPEEALELYRGQVDPLAERWYEQGVAGRDRELLRNVVDQAFASRFGDDALMALGEMAFESGDFASARWYWERIVPAALPPDAARTWPGFPDTDLDLAAVRARLVLVSILEGSTDRAGEELAQFARLHDDARGRLAGSEVNYAESLRAMLEPSVSWPRAKPAPDWPTFAGNTMRNKTAPEMVDPAAVAWRMPLHKTAAGATVLGSADVRFGTVAEDPGAALSYHPALAGGLLLIGGQAEIRAVRVASGKPAWDAPAAAIYRGRFEGIAEPRSQPPNTLGMPRYTVTVCDGKLYARMGSPLTSRSQRVAHAVRAGYLVCLDLAAEGRLMWKIEPEPGWAFEGSPAADRAGVYVGLRRSDIRPQAHVACFDAQTGRLRWRRFICGAETPARGVLNQTSHNLLTLERETLYYNTNLGAVAALSKDRGRLRWVSLYPRARRGNLLTLASHWQRDLNPCVYDRGTLLVAPADSPRIFAFDAATGQILWHTGSELAGAVHLLGTSEDYLIAGGDKLYWIGLKGEDRGHVKHVWPQGHEKPGYGRGLLAAGHILWPTRAKIYVFDQNTAQPKKVIDLAARHISGGNLLVAGRHLLIATGTELIALESGSDQPKESTPSFTRSAWERSPGRSASLEIVRRPAFGELIGPEGRVLTGAGRGASRTCVPTRSVENVCSHAERGNE